MSNQIQIFMTPDDENTFSEDLRRKRGSLRFIDGEHWETQCPPEKKSLNECSSSIVYLWDRDIFPTLPSIRMNDGRFQGPQVGFVLQLVRSVVQNGCYLLSGRVAHGPLKDEKQVGVFYSEVVKYIKKNYVGRLELVDPVTYETIGVPVVNTFYAGRNCSSWLAEDDTRLLKSRSSKHFYRLLESPGSSSGGIDDYSLCDREDR